MKENKTPLILITIAAVWFVLTEILFRTIGMAMAPSGGIDMIASALVYVFLWRIIIFGPPIILIIIALLILLKRKDFTAFKFLLIGAAVIVLGFVLYNTAGKRILYTPSYMASHSQAFDEYCNNNLNELEKTSHTEQDHIMSYVYWQAEHILSKTKKWVDSPEEEKEYVEAFLDYRLKELPNVKKYEYLPDIFSILQNKEQKTYLTDEQLDEVLSYTKANAWCLNHYGYSTPIVSSDNSMVIIYYNDNTVDLIEIYTLDY